MITALTVVNENEVFTKVYPTMDDALDGLAGAINEDGVDRDNALVRAESYGLRVALNLI